MGESRVLDSLVRVLDFGKTVGTVYERHLKRRGIYAHLRVAVVTVKICDVFLYSLDDGCLKLCVFHNVCFK